MFFVVNKCIEVFHCDVFDLSKLAKYLLDVLLSKIPNDSGNVDLSESFRIYISSIFTVMLSMVISKPTSVIVPRIISTSVLLSWL